VQNQVWAASPTRFIDLQRPSDIFESLVATEPELLNGLLEVLETEYEKNGEFTDYVDIMLGADWREKIIKMFFPALVKVLDSESSYTTLLSGYLDKALKSVLPGISSSEDIIAKIVDWLEASQYFAVEPTLGGSMIANNPQTKISTPPVDAKIALNNSVDLGLDYRGVEFVKGYSTLEEYWGNIPYPGMESPSVLPSTLRDSVLQGLVGYASTAPLEAIYNPIAADSISNLNLKSLEAINGFLKIND
jgi:hypothetical protein